MKVFDRKNLVMLHADIVDALKVVEKQHGITINVAMGRFSPHEYRTKLTASTGEGKGVATTFDRDEQAKKDFGFFAVGLGLKKEDFGSTFTQNRSTYTICGLKPHSFKYPVLAKSNRGRTYKFTVAQVLDGLGRHKEAQAVAARRGLF